MSSIVRVYGSGEDTLEARGSQRFSRLPKEVGFRPYRNCTLFVEVKGKGSPYSITERRVPELIPVLGSQPAGEQQQQRPFNGL